MKYGFFTGCGLKELHKEFMEIMEKWAKTVEKLQAVKTSNALKMQESCQW